MTTGQRDMSVDVTQMLLCECFNTKIRVCSLSLLFKYPFLPGGNIDNAHHGGHAKVALYDTLAFQDAVAMAINLTHEEDTLIVVTADTSEGLSLLGYPSRGNSILGKKKKILARIISPFRLR